MAGPRPEDFGAVLVNQAKPEDFGAVRVPTRPQYDKAAAGGVQRGIAGLAGLPVDTAENIINLALAGYGAIRTAGGNPDAAPNLLRGSPGGSQWITDRLRKMGVNVDNPNPEDPASRAIFTTGTVMGSGGPRSGKPAVAAAAAQETLGPEWAAPASMVPGAVPRVLNAATESSRAAAQTHNTLRDSTLKQARDAGYVVPPSQTNASFLGNRAESVAGKAALNQEATLRNQVVTDKLARHAIGFPEGVPLTPRALEAHRKQVAEPYRQISALSPVANKALERLQDARSEAHAYWTHFDRQAVPESRRLAIKFDRQVETLERVIEREASRAGKPELVAQLKNARATIAKTWDVERALNVGDGHVDARVIGRAFDRGRPLTGELQTIAKFSEAFPQVSRSAAGTPTPGVSALEPVAAAGLGIGGHAAGMGWWPSGVVLAGGPTRSALLSDWYQRKMGQPDYGPTGTDLDVQYLLRPSVLMNER